MHLIGGAAVCAAALIWESGECRWRVSSALLSALASIHGAAFELRTVRVVSDLQSDHVGRVFDQLRVGVAVFAGRTTRRRVGCLESFNDRVGLFVHGFLSGAGYLAAAAQGGGP